MSHIIYEHDNYTRGQYIKFFLNLAYLW